MARDRRAQGASGFALILAILVLMLLTFLGLTLVAGTSTELQIATNYRWSQQAYYLAEAGIEAGKSLLRNVNWELILPPPRETAPSVPLTWMVGAPAAAPTARLQRNDQWGTTSRNYENTSCDARGGRVGYGVVFDDGGSAAPYQHKTTLFGQTANGAFTLWIRRPLMVGTDGSYADYNPAVHGNSPDDQRLVVTAEGVAPFTGGSLGMTIAQANGAVRVLEMEMSRMPIVAADPCGGRGGQVGGGPEGAGFGGCDSVTNAGGADDSFVTIANQRINAVQVTTTGRLVIDKGILGQSPPTPPGPPTTLPVQPNVEGNVIVNSMRAASTVCR